MILAIVQFSQWKNASPFDLPFAAKGDQPLRVGRNNCSDDMACRLRDRGRTASRNGSPAALGRFRSLALSPAETNDRNRSQLALRLLSSRDVTARAGRGSP